MPVSDYCDCGWQLPDCILTSRLMPDIEIRKAKPWTDFPTDIDRVPQHADNPRLRHWMSCPEVLGNLHKETREKALDALHKELHGTGSYAVMRGGQETQWSYYQSDTLMCIFKQEQFFRYIFGCDLPDLAGVIDIDFKKVTLFVPQIPEKYRAYLGDQETLEVLKTKWLVDEVRPFDDLQSFVEELDSRSKKGSKCLLLEGINSDSGIKTDVLNIADVSEFIIKADVNREILYNIIEECRVTKTPREIEMLRCCAYISSMAHAYVMKHTTAGLEELFHEALFKSICSIVGGARNVAYNCICASEINAAILHYGHAARPNDRSIHDGDLLLHDMGGIFPCGYVADITVTYPVSGKFSDDQKIIYNAVLKANHAVQKTMKPGISWVKMHELAELEILKGLRAAGVILKDVHDDQLEEFGKKRLCGYFMPHGLGHLIGLDVHDCGAHCPKVKESIKDKKGIENLRCTRDLEENMYITVEPGCYFIPYLIDELKKDETFNKHINFERLDSLVPLGGIRIEDDVFVTKDGCHNVTVVPRTIEEIESFLAA